MDLFNSPRLRAFGRTMEQTEAIKAQVIAQLKLNEDASVMVTELACEDEGCPDVETIVAVFRPAKTTLRIKLPLALADVTAGDVEAACQHQLT